MLSRTIGYYSKSSSTVEYSILKINREGGRDNEIPIIIPELPVDKLNQNSIDNARASLLSSPRKLSPGI